MNLCRVLGYMLWKNLKIKSTKNGHFWLKTKTDFTTSFRNRLKKFQRIWDLWGLHYLCSQQEKNFQNLTHPKSKADLSKRLLLEKTALFCTLFVMRGFFWWLDHGSMNFHCASNPMFASHPLEKNMRLPLSFQNSLNSFRGAVGNCKQTIIGSIKTLVLYTLKVK